MATHKKSPTKTSTAKKHGTEKHAAEKHATEKSVAAKPRSGRESPSPIVTLDRRASHERRNQEDHRKQEVPVVAERRTMERRAKVSRRRQIDPTTCERDYSTEEIEFMGALDEYKRTSGRMFPTCSEVLEVLKKLGYEKRSKEDAMPTPIVQSSVDPSQRHATVVA